MFKLTQDTLYFLKKREEIRLLSIIENPGHEPCQVCCSIMTIFISAVIFGDNICNQVKEMFDNVVAIILQSVFRLEIYQNNDKRNRLNKQKNNLKQNKI
jgi:hypothetical protein